MVILAIVFMTGNLIFQLPAVLILLTEAWRIRKIHKEFDDDLTPDLIREYYSKDPAFKWLPIKDQISGLKRTVSNHTT